MQPEEIIQQKQWDELTATEKVIVLPLASTKEEYTLLKSILEVAVEDIEPVPVIDSAIHLRLQVAVANNSQKKNRKIFYYAAASIAAIIIAGWFIFQSNTANTKDDMVNIKSPSVTIDTTFHKKQLLPTEKETAIKDAIAVKENNKSDKKKFIPQVKNNNTPSIQQLAAINTFINNDSTMLAVLTEVY
jgi:hypothetical protein